MVKVVFNANSANPSTTVYVSGFYQIADGPSTGSGQAVATKYYEGGAFRVGGTHYYSLGDCPSSTVSERRTVRAMLRSTCGTISTNGTKFAKMG